MSERLVELTDITTGYDGVVAIEHVNLTINERDYIGIIGQMEAEKLRCLR